MSIWIFIFLTVIATRSISDVTFRLNNKAVIKQYSNFLIAFLAQLAVFMACNHVYYKIDTSSVETGSNQVFIVTSTFKYSVDMRSLVSAALSCELCLLIIQIFTTDKLAIFKMGNVVGDGVEYDAWAAMFTGVNDDTLDCVS